MVVGDFNGDGIPDLVFTSDGDRVRLLLGNGDGTFQVVAQSYAAGSLPSSLAAADFTGDGYLDLAVGNKGQSGNSVYAGSVSLLVNGADWGGGHAAAPHKPNPHPVAHRQPRLPSGFSPLGFTSSLP